LERGFGATSVDDIASRAGVSRATFFNYFPTKSDVLWVEVDQAIGRLEVLLTGGVLLGAALFRITRIGTLTAMPLIATQSEAMQVEPDMRREGGARIALLAAAIDQAGVVPEDVWYVTAALVRSGIQWVRAGTTRRELWVYLEEEMGRLHPLISSHTAELLSYTEG